MDIVETDCNANGVTPKVCPTGFACTGTETRPLGPNTTATRPICEPTRSPLAPLIFDLTLPAVPPAATVAVHVDFTLNGSGWPTSSLPGGAGRVSFFARNANVMVIRDVPTQSGRLDVELAPDDYTTFISMNGQGIDVSRYPTTLILGVLRVVATGTVAVNLTGQPLSYAVRLDGQPFPQLPANESASLALRGRHGQTLSLGGTGPGNLSDGVVVLEPDSYEITLQLRSNAAAPSIPYGDVILDEAFAMTTARAAVFDATTFPIAGTVRVDGADLPAGASARVLIGPNSFPVSTTAPASYHGRLLAGSYDVVLDTSRSSSPLVPAAATRLTSASVAGPATLDLAATTTMFTGALTLNHIAPPDAAFRGSLSLSQRGVAGTQRVSLSPTGPAQWSTRIYTGSYDVSLSGVTPAPTYEIRLETNLAANAAISRSYNVDVGTATINLLDDGRQPADAASQRGTITLHHVGTDSALTATPPNTGPLSAAITVEAGTWSVDFTASSAAGLPVGSTRLGDITVPAGGTAAMTFDLHGVTVSGEVRLAGQPLPPSTPGHVRPKLSLTGAFFAVPLSSTGPATFNFRVVPGIYDITLSCDSTCDPLPGFFLATGLALR